MGVCPTPSDDYAADPGIAQSGALSRRSNEVEPSDEALLAGFATGDPRTAAAFVRRFQGRVYGLALTIVRQPAVAEEVAQETFTRVYRHAGNYDARQGPGRDLAALDRPQPRDRPDADEAARPGRPGVIAAEVSIESQTPGADETGMQPDERAELRSAIGELPDDQRRALVLATYMGRTAREISDLDDVPLGTVKTRIRTAMLKLRDRARGARVMDPALRADPRAGAGAGARHRRGRGARPRAPAPGRVPRLPPAGRGALRGRRRAAPAGAAPRAPGRLRVARARRGGRPRRSPGAAAGWRLVLAPVAAAAAAAAIVLAIVAPDLRLASHYRHTLDQGERQGVRVLRPARRRGRSRRHRVQLRGIPLVGPHRRRRRAPRRACSAPSWSPRTAARSRCAGSTSIRERRLGRLDPGGPEAGLRAAAQRAPGHRSRWSPTSVASGARPPPREERREPPRPVLGAREAPRSDRRAELPVARLTGQSARRNR